MITAPVTTSHLPFQIRRIRAMRGFLGVLALGATLSLLNCSSESNTVVDTITAGATVTWTWTGAT
ncbi:MAG: hypothetical protein ACREL3_06155 [Gemmatimonadales bacterium]